jgi:hypothetical protein
MACRVSTVSMFRFGWHAAAASNSKTMAVEKTNCFILLISCVIFNIMYLFLKWRTKGM